MQVFNKTNMHLQTLNDVYTVELVQSFHNHCRLLCWCWLTRRILQNVTGQADLQILETVRCN